MTDILEFIKLQRSKGFDDYAVLQAAKKMTKNLLNNDVTTGGAYLDANKLDSSQVKKIVNETMNSFDRGEGEEANIEEQCNKCVTGETDELLRLEEKPVQFLVTLPRGMILYHPSQDVKQFSDAMIFVELPKVLDKTNQRSFTMFFTPSMEYARRFSGLWSLNKRTVYIHKMVVDKPITGIQVMNSKNESDNVNNVNLAQGKCGSSEYGFINGIKVSYPIKGNKDIDEYYICNPDMFFKHVDTWAQFSPTEWVKITNTEKISVEDEEELNDKNVSINPSTIFPDDQSVDHLPENSSGPEPKVSILDLEHSE